MQPNDAHYSDENLTVIYDCVNAGRSDFDFYLSKLPAGPARILDIGCGTGAFAADLSELGHHVTGLDPSSQMISVARQKPGSDAVEWIVGTSTDLPANARYDAVFMTGHAFQCILRDEDILALLTDLRRCMSDRGEVWFESRNPGAKAWERWVPEHSARQVKLSKTETLKISHSLLSVEDEIVTFEESYLFLSNGMTKASVSALRFASDATIAGLAQAAGLKVKALFGDWGGGPFNKSHSPEMIFCLTPV